MAAEELVGFDKLRERLSRLDETKGIAQRELQTLNERKERIAELERDRGALVESYVRDAGERYGPVKRRRKTPRLSDATITGICGAGRKRTEADMLIDYTANLEATLFSVKTASTSMSVHTADL